MTNFSQQQPVYQSGLPRPIKIGFVELGEEFRLPVNILKLCCVLIGQNLISEIIRVFFKLAKASFAFCHSVTSFHFGKQCRVKKHCPSLFLFKAELECNEINVTETQTPIPPMLKSIPAKFFKAMRVFHFSLGIVNCIALGRCQAKSNMPRCFTGYLYSLNFVKSQIIPSIN